MPKRVAVQTIRVLRGKEVVSAPLGEPFDFTDQEIADVEAVNPDAFRMPVNEDVPAQEKVEKAKKGKKADSEEEMTEL